MGLVLDWPIFSGYLVPFVGFMLMALILYRRRFKAGAVVVAASSLVFGGAGLISSVLSSSSLSGVDGFVLDGILISWFVSFSVGLFYTEIIRARHQKREGSTKQTTV
jgi:hypothetical protein